MKIKLKNGIVLDSDNEMAISLQKYAVKKGLHTARVFVAQENNEKTYLLVMGESPEFESQRAEDIAVHIDILALQKKFYG